MIHSLFRLRNGNDIVGYMKVFSQGNAEFSHDQFWWTGTHIDYQSKDHYCGIPDKNNRPLFELDVVKLKPTFPTQTILGVIQFKAIEQAFIVIDLDTQDEYNLFNDSGPIFHKSQLTFVGCSFEEKN